MNKLQLIEKQLQPVPLHEAMDFCFVWMKQRNERSDSLREIGEFLNFGQSQASCFES